MRSKFSSVHSSHDLCACTHAHSLEVTLLLDPFPGKTASGHGTDCERLTCRVVDQLSLQASQWIASCTGFPAASSYTLQKLILFEVICRFN